MPARKKDYIPPEARGTPRRQVKAIARFGAEEEDDDDDDMPLGQARLQAAETRLVQGTMIERCKAVLDLMQLRPDAFIFAKPVTEDDVPDYFEIITEPSAPTACIPAAQPPPGPTAPRARSLSPSQDNGARGAPVHAASLEAVISRTCPLRPGDYQTVKSKLDGDTYGEDHLRCNRPLPRRQPCRPSQPRGALASQHRRLPRRFADDMRRIFMNACKYNWRPDHEIHIAARQRLLPTRVHPLPPDPLRAAPGSLPRAQCAVHTGCD